MLVRDFLVGLATIVLIACGDEATGSGGTAGAGNAAGAGGGSAAGGASAGSGGGGGASGVGGAGAAGAGASGGDAGASGAGASGGNSGASGASGTGGAFDCASPDPDWLMCEDFEAGNGDFETWFGTTDFLTSSARNDRSRLDLSNAEARSGSYSVHMPAPASAGYQGADLGWVSCAGAQQDGCDPAKHEELYFRAFVRFAPDHEYVHHFVLLGGRDRYWAYGSAGCLPNGTSEIETHVDLDEGTHESFFYTYHLDMSCDANCGNYADVDSICAECAGKGFPTCTNQKQCCWGNHFRPSPAVAFPVGEWFCLEMMMKANTPSVADGVMAYWVNGAVAHEESAIRWRTTPDLALNFARLQHYIADGDATKSNAVWFDDVVVSTSRIGCGVN